MPPSASTLASTATILGLALLGGCSPTPTPPTNDTGSDSGTTEASGPMGTTFSAPDACEASGECEGEDLLCVAPYDPGSDPPVGPGACVSTCIEANDLSQWCFDDAGCCDALRCNPVDGFCESLTEGTDDTGGDTESSGSSGSGTSGSGTSDSGSSDSGSGSSGGSTGASSSDSGGSTSTG